MSVELLKHVIARRAMIKDAALAVKYPALKPAQVQPAAPAVDKKAAVSALLSAALGKQASASPAAPAQPQDSKAVVAELIQKNAGVGLDLGRRAVGVIGKGLSAAGKGIANAGKATGNFVAAHPAAAAASATGVGGYLGGKTVGYVQGRKAQGANDADQIARYGVTAGGAALGGLGGNLLAGAFGGGRVARTLATLLGAAGGGAAGYYGMDPAVQAKVKSLFS